MSKWAAAFVFCAIVALAPVSSNAFTLMGWGTASCADWTAARKEDNADYHEQWVLGFLSGVGAAAKGSDPLHDIDAAGVWAWVDKYCTSNPLHAVSLAATAFAREHP